MLSRAGSGALLEIDPDLGAELDPRALERARESIRVALFRLELNELRGKWPPERPPGLAGLIVAEGAILREVKAAARVTAELIGPGDLIRPFEEDGEEDLPVRAEICWRVVQPVVFGAIDARVLQLCAHWPAVLEAMIGRLVGRTQRLSVNLSISHQVRISNRLLLLFWHMAAHWGRVGPHGVVIDLPLTHSQLAQLIGAERPSVSTALSQLAEEGLIERLESRGWCLCGPVPDDVGELLTHPAALRATTGAVGD